MYGYILLTVFVFGTSKSIPLSVPISNAIPTPIITNLNADIIFESNSAKNDNPSNSSAAAKFIADLKIAEDLIFGLKKLADEKMYGEQFARIKNMTTNDNSTATIDWEEFRKLIEKIKSDEMVDESKSSKNSVPKSVSTGQTTVDQLLSMVKIFGNAYNSSSNKSNIVEVPDVVAAADRPKNQFSMADTRQKISFENTSSNGRSKEAELITSPRPVESVKIEGSSNNIASNRDSQIYSADKKEIVDSTDDAQLRKFVNKSDNVVTFVSNFSVVPTVNDTILTGPKMDISANAAAVFPSTDKSIETPCVDNTTTSSPPHANSTESLNQTTKLQILKTIKNKLEIGAAEWIDDHRRYSGTRMTETPRPKTSPNDALIPVEGGETLETRPFFYPVVISATAMQVVRNTDHSSLPTRVEPFFWYMPDYYSMSAIPYPIFHRQKQLSSATATDKGSQNRRPRFSLYY